MLYLPWKLMSITPASVPLAEDQDSVIQPTFWERSLLCLRYIFTTEVHVFAFAIAANVLLSFVPFSVLLMSLCRNVLHSQAAYDAVKDVLRDNLPAGQEFITRNLEVMVRSHGRVQFISFALLLFTASGVLLPLEVALNRIWRIKEDRSYLKNALFSFALAFCCGSLAFLSVLMTGVNRSAIAMFLGTGGIATWSSWIVMKIIGFPVTVCVIFLLYYCLPNAAVPALPMLRAAIFAGLLMETGKYLYIWTLPWLNFQEAYGPFAISVTLIFWAFLASLILLVGAHASAENQNRNHR
jgi:membrane protein